MIQLLIARHGNTFDKGDTILRVGSGTDLPLSQSGQQQAKALGDYLKEHHPQISVVYTSHLKRTIQTAEIALHQMQLSLPTIQHALFNEVHYGPDEGKPESEVIARLGQQALLEWEKHNIVPADWPIEPQSIKQGWVDFASKAEHAYPNQTILIVTSNGIARFAPNHAVKLSTGAVSLLTVDAGQWQVEFTNRKPI